MGECVRQQAVPVTRNHAKHPLLGLCMRITETEIALRRPTGAFPRPEIISRAEQKDIAKGGHWHYHPSWLHKKWSVTRLRKPACVNI